MMPDEPSREEQLEQLPEDNETPFRPADDSDAQGSGLPLDHPATDTNMQPEETYDEGYAGAAEAEEPNAQSAVQDYNPANDQRTQNGKLADTSSIADEPADESAGSPS